MSQVKALKFVKPFVIPDIGRVDESFGPFRFDAKTYAYRDAIQMAGRAGIIALTECEESDVRDLAPGMSLTPGTQVVKAPPQAPPGEGKGLDVQ
jgi:hypothetical protein